ncbi:MAG: hypothetical protein ACTSVA_09540 [Candidatus Njordarchaeales archaeon]
MSLLERIEERMKRIERSLNYLKSLLFFSSEDIALKKFETDLFEAEVRLFPLEKDYVKAIIRVRPKTHIDKEILGAIYYSELFVHTEDAIVEAVQEDRARKMLMGEMLHVSRVINKKLIKFEVKRLLLKIRRALETLADINKQREIRSILNELAGYRKDVSKNRKKIILAVMRLNEILFYGE